MNFRSGLGLTLFDKPGNNTAKEDDKAMVT